NQVALERENFLFDQLASKAVQRVTAPYANKRIVTDQAIGDVLNTLVKAQQAGYGSCGTSSFNGVGTQFGGMGSVGAQFGGLGNVFQQQQCREWC
ncbi:UNVERIFIED_CONTAM: hypothetical protein HDU68_004184, partial [Siphonaria sp. JEL0065]